jgi:hypothetical protein
VVPVGVGELRLPGDDGLAGVVAVGVEVLVCLDWLTSEQAAEGDAVGDRLL